MEKRAAETHWRTKKTIEMSNSAFGHAFELKCKLELMKNDGGYFALPPEVIKTILLMFVEECRKAHKSDYVNDLYYDDMKEYIEKLNQ